MSYKLQKITAKHRHAAFLISLGMSNKEVAVRSGVRPKTIEQWKQSRLFQELINQAYKNRREEVMDEFVVKSKKVQGELEHLALDKDIPLSIKIKAIRDWLNRAGMVINPKALQTTITQELKELEKKRETRKVKDYLDSNPKVKELLSNILVQVSKKASEEEKNG